MTSPYTMGHRPTRSREEKYLAAKLALVQDAKAEDEIEKVKNSEALRNADTLMKPLQGEEFVYKRGRLLGLGVTPPARNPGLFRAADERVPVSAVDTAPEQPQPAGGSAGRH